MSIGRQRHTHDSCVLRDRRRRQRRRADRGQYQRFSERIGHGAVFFKNRYWVIGGASPVVPRAGSFTDHDPSSDVWSSADGKPWRLETGDAQFGRRWLHQALVYNDAIWVLSGVRENATPPASGFNDVWRSDDGVNWTLVTSTAPFMGIPRSRIPRPST